MFSRLPRPSLEICVFILGARVLFADQLTGGPLGKNIGPTKGMILTDTGGDPSGLDSIPWSIVFSTKLTDGASSSAQHKSDQSR